MTTTLTRYAAIINLRPDKEAEYRALHAEVWPSVCAGLKRANISNYSIFLRDGLLITYSEYQGVDRGADLRAASSSDAVQEWTRITGACQLPLPSAEVDEWWAPGEELFHMD